MGARASANGAIERTLALIEPARRAAAARTDEGYLDLLGEQAAAGAHPGQRLMEAPGLARIYTRLWRPMWGRLLMGATGPGAEDELRMALEMLEASPGDSVLDVGSGPGNFTREFGRAVREQGLAVGVDASRSMLSRAVREAGAANVAYVRADAAELPFSDASFDAVCCFAALYLIERPMKALDEMIRVLAPGGRVGLLASTTRGPLPAPLANALVQTLAGVRVFGRDQLTRALRERGMAEVAQKVAGLAQFVSARKPGAVA